jgi:hypothetical protein
MNDCRRYRWLGVAVLLVSVSCGGRSRSMSSPPIAVPRPETIADRMLALLPQGAQLVIEVDLARLRANSVVGPFVVKALGPGGIDRLAGFADADQVTFAAYGLGTAQAATVTLMTAKQPLEGTTKIADGIYAVGPTDWVAQVESRAAIERSSPLSAPKELLELRDHAMPPKAAGSALRITAKLSFDARVALARLSGIESAPAALSVWADVADDFGIVIDAEGTDPGEKKPDKALARMKGIVDGAIRQLAKDPTVIAVGLPGALEQAKVVTRGTWVRAIIAIGPRHLERVVQRAGTLLEP